MLSSIQRERIVGNDDRPVGKRKERRACALPYSSIVECTCESCVWFRLIIDLSPMHILIDAVMQMSLVSLSLLVFGWGGFE